MLAQWMLFIHVHSIQGHKTINLEITIALALALFYIQPIRPLCHISRWFFLNTETFSSSLMRRRQQAKLHHS